MNERERFIALAAEGKALVQVSIWRGWANEVLDIFDQAGYKLRDVASRQAGDSSYTQDTTYDFIFERRS